MEERQPSITKHFCNAGDLIASMAGLKGFYQKTNSKIILAQQLNVEANYYEGATHETRDPASDKMVMMNERIFEMIKPLVESQEYIKEMVPFEGQSPIIIDIDKIRKEKFVNLPFGAIQQWIMIGFPDLAYDLSKSWIDLPDIDSPIVEQSKGKILLNFTERYRNGHIHYFFLRKFKRRLLFAGTAREHLLFCNKWKIDMPLLKVNNFLELAYAIKNCRFLLSNQSMMWNIAEAMKTPRVLEICSMAPNCQPFIGEKSYGFLHQEGAEYYVDELTGDL